MDSNQPARSGLVFTRVFVSWCLASFQTPRLRVLLIFCSDRVHSPHYSGSVLSALCIIQAAFPRFIATESRVYFGLRGSWPYSCNAELGTPIWIAE